MAAVQSPCWSSLFRPAESVPTQQPQSQPEPEQLSESTPDSSSDSTPIITPEHMPRSLSMSLLLPTPLPTPLPQRTPAADVKSFFPWTSDVFDWAAEVDPNLIAEAPSTRTSRSSTASSSSRRSNSSAETSPSSEGERRSSSPDTELSSDEDEEFEARGYSTSTVVTSTRVLNAVLDRASELPTYPPSIYMDMEGRQLGRDGTASVLTIYLRPLNAVYLIDLHTMGAQAFETSPSSGLSLKALLESATIPKVFFDARSPSDALYNLYGGINLQNIWEVQLMELRRRSQRANKKLLNGLAKCVERDARLTAAEKASWLDTRDRAQALTNPTRGGSDEALEQRPLRREVVDSCAQSTVCMAKLWDIYRRKQTRTAVADVRSATEDRILKSHAADYVGQGKHMALGPW